MVKVSLEVSSIVIPFVTSLEIQTLCQKKIGIRLSMMQFIMVWIGYVLPSIKDYINYYKQIMERLLLRWQLEK